MQSQLRHESKLQMQSPFVTPHYFISFNVQFHKLYASEWLLVRAASRGNGHRQPHREAV